MRTDIAIVGGGLAGLALARRLHQAGTDFRLFEAKGQLGGRILTQCAAGASLDLGPAWFWGGQQRIISLVAELGLTRLSQYAEGANVFEDGRGRVRYGQGLVSMAGSWRIEGGTARLAAAVADALPSHTIHTDMPITAARSDGTLTFADGRQCVAQRIVLTMPPRIAAKRLDIPELGQAALAAMEAIPTWMAGHAKFFAVYECPFWREQGLSGDAFSQHGPLVEIHDASSALQGAPGVLFGFVGVSPNEREGHDEQLQHEAIAQLGRLFGAQAAAPLAVHYKDWSTDAFVAVAADRLAPKYHPRYRLPDVLRRLWNDRLILCGSETAPDYGGFMEGALSAAQAVAQRLI